MKLMRTKVYRLSVIITILVCFAPLSLISKSVQGATVGSQMISSNGKTSMRAVEEEKVRRTLENKIVAERLKNYGLSKEEVIAKMGKMNDEQIHQIASLSDRIPAGGNGAVGFVVGVLVVVVLVLLILYLVKRV
ncbi:MAG: PA2779 family protein [Thermodesulfobacteriota bacterium]